MEDQTFRSRVVELIKRCRKATRLYGSVTCNPRDPSSKFNEMQADEWRNVNAELLRLLAISLDNHCNRRLTADIFAMRDRFQDESLAAENDLLLKQQGLSVAAGSGDFVKAAMLSRELVSTKARLQASQAVHHELNDLIKRSKITIPTIELSEVIETKKVPLKNAKVVPLRRNERA